jgi:hypothetical protein
MKDQIDTAGAQPRLTGARRRLPVSRLHEPPLYRCPPHRPWARGGSTDLDNLILLCRRHHRLVHEGEFSVSGNANRGVVFRDRRGERLDNSPQPPPGSLAALLARNEEAGLRIDHHTLLKGDGERMDLEENVYAVAQAIKGPRPVVPL